MDRQQLLWITTIRMYIRAKWRHAMIMTMKVQRRDILHNITMFRWDDVAVIPGFMVASSEPRSGMLFWRYWHGWLFWGQELQCIVIVKEQIQGKNLTKVVRYLFHGPEQ